MPVTLCPSARIIFMKITHFFTKHYINIISALIVISVIVFGCFVFNLFIHGVWALPFDQHSVATVKTTNQDTGEEKYYTIYANGNCAEIQNPQTSELVSRKSNEIQFFDKKFSTVDLVSFDYTVNEPSPIRHFHYYDAEGNRYDEFPTVSDPDLLAIEKEFFEAVEALHKMDIRIFRDGNTIYISAFSNSGFVNPTRVLYRYTLSSKKLDYIGQLSDKEITDWIYLK